MIDHDLLALLAEVCGYHTGDGCEHCAEALQIRRDKGRSNDEIADDVRLFRDDYPAWYARAVERAAVTS